MTHTADARELCLRLIRADTEADAIKILQEAGYWDRPELWRHYGDVENNWGQSGNQQSLAEAALAEKIVNSVDARLINECLARGIDPRGDQAPQTVRSAVARFFENSAGDKLATGGYLEDWTDDELRAVANGITLCATGTRPQQLNITIADVGEGQTPDRLPETILSLGKSNKTMIPFVQGQFNQGGTGALRFCGKHNLQLVVSRRNPALLDYQKTDRDMEWGFSVVRRERPNRPGGNSVYTYLAPVGMGQGSDDRKGEVLSFRAEGFGIFPDKTGPHNRRTEYGTAIKLYDFRYRGEKSNILRGKSILSRLDLLLPEVALPVRFYEYRKNDQGKYLAPGSRETTLRGLKRRLMETKNVEDGFPIDVPFAPMGEPLQARIYAFKERGADADGAAVSDDDYRRAEDKMPIRKRKKLGGAHSYRKREGVVFVRNGQSQGALPRDFLKRDSVKMKSIADDLLIFIDCDGMTDSVREDLFMPSRDRLADDDFKPELISALEKAIRECEPLKDLRNRRQEEQARERVKDDAPLAEVLQSLIKSSPNLTTLLEMGQRISAPFKTIGTSGKPDAPFVGEIYPNFFKLKGVEYGQLHKRNCPINQRMRLIFETDARNDYFTRRIEAGAFTLVCTDQHGNACSVSPIGPNLKNGIATVTLDLPHGATIDDVLHIRTEATDTRASFVNEIQVTITKAAQPRTNPHKRRNRPSKDEGSERERPNQVATPDITRVYKEDWERHGFDDETALTAVFRRYAGEDDEAEIYEFMINMDNGALENEIKMKRLDKVQAVTLKEQFMYANVLIGLSLLLDHKKNRKNGGEGIDENEQESIEARIGNITRSLAPFLPALITLGSAPLGEDAGIDGIEDVG